MEIVAVTFADSTTYDFWAAEEDATKTECRVCVAVGMLVKKDDKIVKVALMSSGIGQRRAGALSNWVDIPASCILSYEVVKTIKEVDE